MSSGAEGRTHHHAGQLQRTCCARGATPPLPNLPHLPPLMQPQAAHKLRLALPHRLCQYLPASALFALLAAE